MNQTARYFLTLGLVASMSILAGCSGEPSNSDLKTAFEGEIQKQKEAIQFMGMGSSAAAKMIPTIEDVEIKDCDHVVDDVYKCLVEVTTAVDGKETSRTAEAKFAKKMDGTWGYAQ